MPHKMKLTPAKARKILKDGMIRGKPLTEAQKKYFGMVAGGGKPAGNPKSKKAKRIKQIMGKKSKSKKKKTLKVKVRRKGYKT